LPIGHDPWETQMLNNNPHIKRYSAKHLLGQNGIIFHNGNCNINKILETLHSDGSYIIISRNRDASYDESIMDLLPRSVKKFYTINTKIKNEIVEPIPVGCATSGGFSSLLPIISKENTERHNDKLIYCRLTLTQTQHGKERRDLVELNKNNPIFTMQLNAVSAEEMYRNMKSHIFTACPAGEGKDCLRTYETIIIGGIPIWSDCPELRHFEDLPVVYTKDWNLTRQWCETSLDELKNRKTSTDRMRMSYWDEEIKKAIKDLL
jgi:hypothetical protein